MSYRKPFTAYQILHAWLETQIGGSGPTRPRGFEVPGDGLSAWGDTKARAAALVESIPLYSLCKRDLIEWCQAGLKELGLVGEFMARLEGYLSQYPFYASTLADVEEGARSAIIYRDVTSVARELGVAEGYLRKVLCTMPTSLPFGSFCERRSWRIHPMDVNALKKHFAELKAR